MRDVREYFRPSSPQEAVELKRRYGPRAVYLGGGSDLLVHRPRGVEAVIDIRHAALGYVRQEADEYVIGGGALLRDVEREVGRVAGGMLTAAIRDTAPWLIRNAATLAGNIANASPAADSVPALLALDADLILLGRRQERVSLASVLAGPHQTTLGDRLIQEIRIPARAAGRRGVFLKLARSKSDIAQVNVALTLRSEGELMRDVRIALGAVAPVTIRATQAESVLEGQALTPDALDRLIAAVRSDVRPISDWRASAEYRRRMSGVLVGRAVRRATNERGQGQ